MTIKRNWRNDIKLHYERTLNRRRLRATKHDVGRPFISAFVHDKSESINLYENYEPKNDGFSYTYSLVYSYIYDSEFAMDEIYSRSRTRRNIPPTIKIWNKLSAINVRACPVEKYGILGNSGVVRVCLERALFRK